jgi:hypothetical protein
LMAFHGALTNANSPDHAQLGSVTDPCCDCMPSA